MSIIVTGGSTGGNYKPHPVDGSPYTAVCCDVVDEGWQRNTYNGEERTRYCIVLVFFCGEWTEPKEIEGETKTFPMTVRKRFTASLHEKAALRAFAKTWRGADFTDEEVAGGFDFERMLGAGGLLQLSSFEYDGKQFTGIDTIMRLPKGMSAPEIPAEYTRVQDRDDWTGPAPHPDEAGDTPVPGEAAFEAPIPAGEDDDELPF